MSSVAVYSYTQSVTYVADNILKSLKDIIRLSGLDPSKLVGEWEVLLRGISSWIESKHLETVKLEIYDPKSDGLITRWDISVSYTWDISAGTFWTDTDQLRYAIKKAGLAPSEAAYRVVVTNKPGRPDVTGWSTCSLRSTDGMVRQSLGTTIEHGGLGANSAYWRKA
ncbi:MULTISPECIES: HORMA domain containing protein [Chromobacterium]|uniref:HORMA domain containing protein n=1 Tax=Chromobacterium TaxID=535 RepID=UPI00188777DC|nr:MULTISPECIES: HORMA domain containing protein [Chromobacterium]QOZ84451.1 HORMA domain containing protein [Chromobacterium sp. Rain0013]WON84634.1 HORMA domain containing protein [Chromobacterium haemolyticum]